MEPFPLSQQILVHILFAVNKHSASAALFVDFTQHNRRHETCLLQWCENGTCVFSELAPAAVGKITLHIQNPVNSDVDRRAKQGRGPIKVLSVTQA